MFKEMLWGDEEQDTEFIDNLKRNFVPVDGFKANYDIRFTDKNSTLVINVSGDKLNCYYGEIESPDVLVTTNKDSFKKIIDANISFQSAFMSGVITAKGNFNTLRMFDSVFRFELINC